jgi:hypothetical protein
MASVIKESEWNIGEIIPMGKWKCSERTFSSYIMTQKMSSAPLKRTRDKD